MASSRKIVRVDEESKQTEHKNNDVSLSDNNAESDEDATDESENEFMNQEVQVEFEARPPEGSDYHGIRILLQQLFLTSNINIGDLADIIISQNYVGNVLKQVDVDDDDDDSMDDDSGDTVLGVVTVINISDRQSTSACIRQLVTMVMSRCESAEAAKAGRVKAILSSPNEQVGFLLNERYINIPPQICVPSFKSLKQDVEKACRKKMNYNFTHFLMLCKTYHSDKDPKVNIYTNGEEELIAEMSDVQVTWSVADQRDGVVEGRWDEDGMDATRTLLLFSADKLDSIISKLESELAT